MQWFCDLIPHEHFDTSRLTYPLHRSINQSINQPINLYRAIVQRRMLQCSYAESKRNVLRRILNVLTDGADRQFSGRVEEVKYIWYFNYNRVLNYRKFVTSSSSSKKIKILYSVRWELILFVALKSQ